MADVKATSSFSLSLSLSLSLLIGLLGLHGKLDWRTELGTREIPSASRNRRTKLPRSAPQEFVAKPRRSIGNRRLRARGFARASESGKALISGIGKPRISGAWYIALGHSEDDRWINLRARERRGFAHSSRDQQALRRGYVLLIKRQPPKRERACVRARSIGPARLTSRVSHSGVS